MKHYLTLLLFFIWNSNGFAQINTNTSGTFTYFAITNDGILCVSDSRITKTTKYNGVIISQDFTDNKPKIFKHFNNVIAFAGNLDFPGTPTNKPIWDLLNNIICSKNLESCVNDIVAQIKYFDPSQTYIKNGFIFIAGINAEGEYFISRIYLESDHTPIIKYDSNFLTNHLSYSTATAFKYLSFQDAFELMQKDILKAAETDKTIGGKLMAYKLTKGGGVEIYDHENEKVFTGLGRINSNSFNFLLSYDDSSDFKNNLNSNYLYNSKQDFAFNYTNTNTIENINIIHTPLLVALSLVRNLDKQDTLNNNFTFADAFIRNFGNPAKLNDFDPMARFSIHPINNRFKNNLAELTFTNLNWFQNNELSDQKKITTTLDTIHIIKQY